MRINVNYKHEDIVEASKLMRGVISKALAVIILSNFITNELRPKNASKQPKFKKMVAQRIQPRLGAFPVIPVDEK